MTGILNDEQAQAFLLSLADVRKQEGFTEEEAQKVIDWAAESVISYSLFQGVISGDMYINVVDGEVVFGITEQGVEYAEANLMGTLSNSDITQ